MCCKDRDYNYWKGQQGRTVRITRGALSGRCGRLKGVCYSYGTVFLAEKEEVPVIWSDLEVTP
jgi:hypothetical protein